MHRYPRQRTGQRCHGVDMLAEDVGQVAGQHVAQYAAAHTGDGAEKGNGKPVGMPQRRAGRLGADDGEDTQTQ